MKTEKFNHNGEIVTRVYINDEDYYYTLDECGPDEILDSLINEADLIKISE